MKPRYITLTGAALILLFAGPSAGADKTRIAILDLKAERGLDQGLVKLLNELILTEFSNSGEYEVIAGSDIDSLLRFEEKKQMLQCSDDGCFAEIGGAMGVEKLVHSNIGKIGDVYLINLKIINVRTAKVENRVSREIPGIEEKLLWAIKSSVAEALGKSVPIEPETAQPSVRESRWPARPGALPITLWSLGGAGIVAGAVCGVLMQGHSDMANDPDHVGAQLEIEKADDYALAANIAFGLGAISILTGVILWLLDEKDSGEGTALVPWIGPGSAGAGLRVDF